jgi:hypothetical protein
MAVRMTVSSALYPANHSARWLSMRDLRFGQVLQPFPVKTGPIPGKMLSAGENMGIAGGLRDQLV